MTDQKQQVQIDVSRVIPIFADEAMVISRIKSKKGTDLKNVAKEGHMEIIFLDQLSQPPKAISRIVISKYTAESLIKVLSDNLSKLDVELKNKKMPVPQKKVEKQEIRRDERDYLG